MPAVQRLLLLVKGFSQCADVWRISTMLNIGKIVPINFVFCISKSIKESQGSDITNGPSDKPQEVCDILAPKEDP